MTIENIQKYLLTSADLKNTLANNYADQILSVGQELVNCYKNGGKVLICGNGGSASDAQHFAGEMVGRLNYDRGALPAIALAADVATLTAIGNDYSFNDIYKRQVEAFGQKGDIFLGLSTSGNSENVIRAHHAAKEKGLTSIALLGRDGGKLKNLVDHKIVIPAQTSQWIQEGYFSIIHIWCEMVESALFPKN